MQQSGTIVNGKSSMNKMPPHSSCFPDWSSGCPNSSGMEPNLSVVTTVWGMTASSQSGPQSTYVGSGPSNNSHNGPTNSTNSGGVPPNYMKNQPYWNNTNQNSGPSYPHQRTEPSAGATSRQDPNYPNQNPLGVTAMVTAIATATATATASVVALQERQEGNSQYQMNSMPNQYAPYNNGSNSNSNPANAVNQAPQRMSTSGGGMMSSGGINNQKITMQQGDSVYGRNNVCRSSPYPTTPPSHINQKRGQANQGIGPNPSSQIYPGPGHPSSSSFEGMNPYGHPAYQSPGQTNVNPRMMYRSIMRPGSGMPGTRNSHVPVPPYSYPPNGQQYYNPSGMHPGNMPQRMGQGVQMSPHHVGLPPGYPHNSYIQHQQSPMSQYSNGPMPLSTYPDSGGTYSSQYGGESRPMRPYPHSPIPGNPTPLTPPLTPASTAPPCYSMHGGSETKPVISTTNESELRLTFPVRDGTILAPFRLEHNLAVSNHVFHLKPTVHQTLTWRSDLELQLKCFHHEDRQMNTNWPASVQVSVNAIPLSIDRGENKISHKPLYLKDICLPGRNTLQITVSACCCSHLFVLQLVHRPSVRSVLQGLLRKRLLPAEHCIAKIKRHFNNNSYYGNQNQGSQDGDGVEQTAVKVSLKCPITYKRMALPARGHDCKHVQCFDLESYLHLNCERASWRCPVCNKTAQLEGLEVDQYIWSILNALTSSDSDEVTIDSAANWRETTSATGFKTKSETVEPCSAKKTKLISPSEMHMSTWNSDMVMSPYGSPSMNNMSMGQSMNPYGSMSSSWSGSPAQSNSFEFGDYGGPLSRLKESVNSLEALNAMEKSISEQASGGGKGFNETNKSDLPYILHTPQTPHTPGTGEHGSVVASSPSHVPNLITSSNQLECDPPNLATLIASDLPSDLNFDPESVINGEGSGQEELNLLPHSGVDPLELLSYLEPSGLATPPSSGDRENGGSNMNSTPDSISDDLLSLFD